jgi:hypothetical protein
VGVGEGFVRFIGSSLCVEEYRRLEPHMICQRLPQLSVDERYYAAGIFWRAAVVLAVSFVRVACLG